MSHRNSNFSEIPSSTRKYGLISILRERLEALAGLRSGSNGNRAGSDSEAESRSDYLAVQKEVFINLMDIAKQIAERDSNGLPRLVTALLRPLQAEQILSVAERTQHSALGAVRFDQLFSPDYFFSFFDEGDCVRLAAGEYFVDLTSDVVLTTPWVRSGFASALAHIGKGRRCGAWRADSNHCITLFLPWRICIVNNGNHSIAAGILGQEGTLAPSSVLDFTPLLSRVECNGIHFICRDTREILGRVRDGRMGALFEIGRLIADSS